jgi:hypothetical protein
MGEIVILEIVLASNRKPALDVREVTSVFLRFHSSASYERVPTTSSGSQTGKSGFRSIWGQAVDRESDRAVCVVPTSGSTGGRVKYVHICESTLCHRFAWQEATFPLEGHSTVLVKSVPTFVDAVWELLAPAIFGALCRQIC